MLKSAFVLHNPVVTDLNVDKVLTVRSDGQVEVFQHPVDVLSPEGIVLLPVLCAYLDSLVVHVQIR